jgi:VanZ family protein
MNYTGNSFLILMADPVNSVNMKYTKTIFWIFTTIIIVQAIAPINGVNSKLNNTYMFYLRLDYLVHVAMFATLSVLFRLAYFPEKSLVFSKAVFYFSVMLTAAFCSEAIQWFVPYRVFNINDLIANFLGVILGFPLTRQWRIFFKKRRKYLQSGLNQL